MKSISEAQQEVADLYRRAVNRHLLSDVPVGLLLSGGLDSGLLLALMNLYGSCWPTYTVGYGSTFADDELTDAEETASLLKSQHTAVSLDISAFECLPKIVSHLEEPIASSSIVPMYFICERASRDLKVVLMGQGPDELFGGYRRHLGLRYASLWTSLPSGLRRLLTQVVTALPRNETLKRGVYSLDTPDRIRRYQKVLSLLPDSEIDSLFHDDLSSRLKRDALLACWQELNELTAATDEFGGFQYLELRSTLPDELLMYADKLSMAHGLEVRVPYLDKDVAQYIERLSSSFKIRNGCQKWLHRRVCRTMLPKKILQRKKRGFAVNVVDQWFRASTRNVVKDILLDADSLMYKYLKRPVVQELLSQHQSRRKDNHKVLFSLVVFEHWLRNRVSGVTHA